VIPVNEPSLKGNEKKYINECIDTKWISSEGAFVERFEQETAKFVGRKYASTCTSGTAALELAVSALCLERGDEVIMPSFTIISCAQALTRRGVIPVLVDCDPVTFNMRPESVESKISKNTKAIMIVHIFGLTVDIDPILKISQKKNLKVIEDAAQAIGQTYKNKQCGSFGDISIFSFYPNKLITTGEGGMVLCNSEKLNIRVKNLRNLCFEEDRFVHHELGYNYRMTNIQAALGLAQLENLKESVKKKRWIGEVYNELLEDIDAIRLPLISTEYCKNIYWVYAIVIKDTCLKSAKEAMNSLSELKIGTRPFFYPMHRQPVFNEMGLFLDSSLPNSEKLYEKGFYIPSGMALTKEQMIEVSVALHKVFS
jgi:perosamine synthetase